VGHFGIDAVPSSSSSESPLLLFSRRRSRGGMLSLINLNHSHLGSSVFLNGLICLAVASGPASGSDMLSLCCYCQSKAMARWSGNEWITC